jgi:hypothetical protein
VFGNAISSVNKNTKVITAALTGACRHCHAADFRFEWAILYKRRKTKRRHQGRVCGHHEITSGTWITLSTSRTLSVIFLLAPQVAQNCGGVGTKVVRGGYNEKMTKKLPLPDFRAV